MKLTKKIDCPEHPGEHKATLFCFGHRYAGTWECTVTGDSDACAHEETEVEQVAASYDPSEEEPAYVCVACGIVTDGDPRADAADAETDRQIDEARGK